MHSRRQPVTRRIVVDLDNTLCRTDGEDYENAEPIKGRIEKLRLLAETEDVEIVVNTARGSGSGEPWYEETREQLDRWQVPYDALIVGEKPPADTYIDDRAQRPEEFFGE